MSDLLLTYDFPPMGGGIARWMAEFAARADLVVSTGTLPNADDQRFGGRVDRLDLAANRLKNFPGFIRWRGRVRTLVQRERPRFVWAGNIRPAGSIAAWTGARDGVPYGLLIHGGDLLQIQDRLHRKPSRRRILRWCLDNAAAIVANSRWTAALTRVTCDQVGAGAGRRLVETVPLGSDPAVFRPGIPTAEVIERYGLPTERTWLLTVARLVRHKGIDTGIEVVARLRNLYPDLSYLIVGNGPDRERLEDLARDRGVADRIAILESVPDQDIPAIHNLAAVYLGLSRQDGNDVEGFGISLVDAQASGVPVIAGRSGGTDDAVLDGETGWLLRPDDPVEIAAQVDLLLADPDRRRVMGTAARDWVVRDRNWDRVTRDLIAVSRRAAISVPR